MVRDPVLPKPSRYPLSVEMFRKLGELGLFPEDTRLELIEGELIEMSPIGPEHAQAVSKLSRNLQRFETEVYVWGQFPLQLSSRSLPMPDITLIKLPVSQYDKRLPLPEDALLVIEVADSSLRLDRGEKWTAYAKAGIPEYWIVNLVDHQLEIYRDPKVDEYLTRTTLQPEIPAQALCLSGPVPWD